MSVSGGWWQPRVAGGRWRVCPAPAPEPEHPYPIPDGRDLGPENVFPPPESNSLGQHAVLPLPAIQLCRDAVPTLPSDTDEHFPLPQPPAEGHSGPRIGGLSIRPIGCIGFIDARTFRRCGKLCEINFATCTRDLAGHAG